MKLGHVTTPAESLSEAVQALPASGEISASVWLLASGTLMMGRLIHPVSSREPSTAYAFPHSYSCRLPLGEADSLSHLLFV